MCLLEWICRTYQLLISKCFKMDDLSKNFYKKGKLKMFMQDE